MQNSGNNFLDTTSLMELGILATIIGHHFIDMLFDLETNQVFNPDAERVHETDIAEVSYEDRMEDANSDYVQLSTDNAQGEEPGSFVTEELEEDNDSNYTGHDSSDTKRDDNPDYDR